MAGERLGDRVAAAAAGALVGRAREAERLRALVDDPGVAVAFLHGAGGIGKTVLLAGVLPAAPAVDGRAVEPTPAGFLAALAGVLGCEPAIPAVAAALEGEPALVVDSYERLPIVDGWLRNELLPALPASVTTVLAGRMPPNVAWRAAPGWRPLLGELVLGPLTDADADALLARRSLPPELHVRARRFGRGHPLALELAARAFARHPDLELPDGPPPEAVEELVDVLLDDLDPETRAVVEAAVLLRRVTEPLLAAVAGEGAWRTLRDLPFTTVTGAGLVFQPVVQEAVAASLELRDAQRARTIRRDAARAALAEIERAPSWEATADLLHLVQNPVIRDAFLPVAGLQHPVEGATPADREAVLGLAGYLAGEATAEVLAAWWDAHREAFSVLRRPDGGIGACSVVREAGALGPGLVEGDPVLRRFLDDLADRPVGPGAVALVHRLAVGAGRAEVAAMIVDVKRSYLELRGRLWRVYATSIAGVGGRRMLQALGFEQVGPPIEVGERSFRAWALEMGPGSVDAWLARHVEVEVATSAGGADDPTLVLLSGLTAREREVLVALADGLSNRELAERLFISERTANRHLSNIFTKLGVRNRTAAARLAVEAGMTTRMEQTLH